MMRHFRKAAVLMACANLASCKKTPVVPPVTPKPAVTGPMFTQNEALLDTLANQVQKKFFSSQAADWQNTNVIVAPFDFKVGELIVPGTTRPLPHDETSCAPPQQPESRNAGSMFPNYRLAGALALDFGLGSLLPVNASAQVGSSSVVDLNFSGTTVVLLTDVDFAKLIATPSCRQAYTAQPLLIVRGYVKTKKKFNIESDLTAQASVGSASGPTANVSAASDEASGYEDEEPNELLLVLSEVSAGTLATSPPSGPLPPRYRPGEIRLAVAAVVTKPLPTAGTGKIYVQRDTADQSGNAAIILANVANVSSNLVQTVQAIPSDKMPKLAQVRYFRSDDKAAADRVLGELKKTYPTAISKFVGLPSPPGQMEIWLPKSE